MNQSLDVLLSPAEFVGLPGHDLSETTCVVFDVLRATSTILTALSNGAEAIMPVETLAEAVTLHRRHPEWVLAGERDGHRIHGGLTGGVEFHLGNSPREFTSASVAGRTIIMTTTNGTRALRSAAAAQSILVGAFLNLQAVANRIKGEIPRNLVLICSGTHEQPAYEDILAAGALVEAIWPIYAQGQCSDAAQIARQIYQISSSDLPSALGGSRNGRRLLGLPDLAADVSFCGQLNLLSLLASMRADGTIVKS